jgi:prepilin-type N-terminal cleavage/methylation domain-containing protein
MYSRKERSKFPLPCNGRGLPLHQNNKLAGGFTLIELMVSVAIFGIVILIGVGALLTTLNANRKTRASAKTIENLGFVLEEMTQSLQNGFLYHCDRTVSDISISRNCGFDTGLGTASSIAFEDINGTLNDGADQIVYRFESGAIEKSVQGNAGPFIPLLDPSITISNLQFHVRGAASDDAAQARVMIIIVGTAGEGDEQTSFNIQTTVRQRVGDS